MTRKAKKSYFWEIMGLSTAVISLSLVIVTSSNTLQRISKNGGKVEASSTSLNCNFYVSSSGSSSGSGSKSSPWDLQTALNQPSAVVPGTTICVNGGMYRGSYISHLKGGSDKPIIVRAIPGERAVLDYHGINLQLAADTAYVWFWGLEVTDSHNARNPYDARMATGIIATRATPASHDIKFINMYVHDVKDSGFAWYESNYNSEIYGSVIVFNGSKTVDHGIYVHNQTGYKSISDNIIGDNASHGVHGYIDGSGKYLNGMNVSGNILYNAGSIGCKENTSTCVIPERNILLGGESGLVTNNATINNNYTYMWSGSGTSVNMGYHGGSSGGRITNNYLMGGIMSLGTSGSSNLTISGNTIFYSSTEGVNTSNFSNNSWMTNKPSGTKIVVRSNAFESGRANIAIYNWNKASAVTLTSSHLAGVELTAGNTYELHNAQNFYGDVISGTYNGTSIVIPMTGRTVMQPLNLGWKPASTFPEFGTFVLIKTGGNEIVPTPTLVPPPTSTKVPPTPTLPATTMTVTLTPVADAYTNSGNSSGNYGSDATLKVNAGDSYMKSYLKFDLSSLAGKTVTSAILRLKTTTYSGAGSVSPTLVIGLSNPAASWSESTITYANRPGLASTVSSFVPNSINTWYQASVTSLAAARTGTYLTIALSTSGTDVAYFSSKEGTDKPQLVLQVR